MRKETGLLERIVHRMRSQRILKIALVVATAVFIVVYSLGRSLDLSAEQQADFQLGTSSSSVDLRSLPLSQAIQDETTDLLTNVFETMSELGEVQVPGATEIVRGTSLPLPMANKRRPVYTEVYSVKDNPLGWRLESGRWPTEPGEVALSRAAQSLAGPDRDIKVPTAEQPLQVVGTYVVPQGYDEVGLVGAPGTWKWFTSPDQASESRPEFAIEIRSDADGGQAKAAFVAVLEKLQPLLSSIDGMDASFVSADALNSVMESFLSRSEIEDSNPSSTLDQDIWVFSVPLVATIFLLIAGAHSLSMRWLKDRITQLTALGVPGIQLTQAYFRVLAMQSASSVGTAILLALPIGFVLRPVVAPLSENDLSPWVIPWKPILLGVLTVVLTIAALYTWSVTSAHRAHLKMHGRQALRLLSRPSRIRTFVVLGLYAVILIAEIALLIGEWSATSMVLQTVLVLFLALTLMVFLCDKAMSRSGRALSARGFAGRLRTHHVLYRSVYVGIVALLTALPICYSSINSTWYNLNNVHSQRLMPEDTVLLGTASFTPLPPSFKEQFEETTELTSPVTIYGPQSDDQTRVVAPTKAANLPGVVFVVDNLTDVDLFLASPLSESDEAKLTNGGILINGSAEGVASETIPFQILEFDAPPTQAGTYTPPRITPIDLLAARVTLKPGWSNYVAAIMLRSLVESQGFPLSSPAFVYSGLSQQDLAAASEASETLINGSNFISVSYEPEHRITPFILTVVGLGLLVLLLLTGSAMSVGIRRQLHDVSMQLQVLGVPQTWFRRVATDITVIPIVCGGVIGVACGLLPAWTFSVRYFGLDLFGYDPKFVVISVGALVLCAAFTLIDPTFLGRYLMKRRTPRPND